MTRDDFANVVAAVLGIHATEGRVDTICVAADIYARECGGQVLEAAER